MLDALADPHLTYPVVHLAGTNGKTSTARFVAGLVSAHGLTPGTFMSPQLEVIEDQIEYAQRQMSREEFAGAVASMEPIISHVEARIGSKVTAFEALTAVALAWFAEMSVDAAIVEAGMGGGGDATNAVSSQVAVVTSVGLDHARYLGATREEVARHKVGILGPGGWLVTGPIEPSVERVAAARVADMGARWSRFGTDYAPDDVVRAVGGWVFDIEGGHGRYEEIGLRVRGRHQVANFTTAVAATEALLDRELDVAAVREVAATASVPGRMEAMGADPQVLLDAAHNPDGMESLVAAIGEEQPTTRWTVVFGVMADKDVDAMLTTLRPVAGELIATAASTPRAMPSRDVAERARSALEVPVSEASSVDDALAAARSAEAEAILVTGSVALVGEARRILGTNGA